MFDIAKYLYLNIPPLLDKLLEQMSIVMFFSICFLFGLYNQYSNIFFINHKYKNFSFGKTNFKTFYTGPKR